MMHSVRESEGIPLWRRLRWQDIWSDEAWVRVAGALLLAAGLIVVFLLTPGVLLKVAALLGAHKELAYPPVAGLALAALVCYATDRTRLGRFLLIALAPLMTSIIALRFLRSRIIWAVLIGVVLAPFVARLGLAVLLNLFAFAVWHQGFFGVYGISLTEGMIYVAFLIWAVHAVGQKKKVASPYLAPLVLLVLCGCVAFFSGLTLYPSLSFTLLRQACFATTAIYILMTNLLQRPAELEQVMFTLLLGGIVLGIILVLGYLGYMEVSGGRARMTQITGIYDVPLIGAIDIGHNTTAVYFSMLAVLALSLYLNGKRAWQQVLGLLVVALSCVVLILMATRVSLIATASGFGMVLALSVKERYVPPQRLLVAIGVVAGVVLLVLGSSYISDRVRLRLLAMKSVELLRSDPMFVSRLEAWRTGFIILRHYPMGTGFIRYYSALGFTGISSVLGFAGISPHSQFLNIALGTGLIGLTAYLAFLGLCLRHLFRGLRLGHPATNWICVGAIGSIVAYLVNALGVDTTRRFGIDFTLFIICGAGVAAVEMVRRMRD